MEKTSYKSLYIIYAVYFLFILLAIWECFCGSKDIDLVSFRHYDDLCFHYVINSHMKDLSQLLNWNDYGYGWIYWIVATLYCSIGWLLCYFYNISWVLCVTPRLVSLVFTLATVCVAYKLVGLYTKDKLLKSIYIFLLPLFPTYLYYGLLFSCNPHVEFFAICAVYALAKNRLIEKKNLYISFLCLCVAIGIKLTAVLILPIWGLLLLSRFNFKLNHFFWKSCLPLTILSIFFTLFLISPNVYIGVFDHSKWVNLYNMFKWATTFGSNGESSFIINFQKGIIHSYTIWPIFVILFVMLLVTTVFTFYSECKRRCDKDIQFYDYIAYILGYVIAVSLLCYRINHGPLFITYYYTCICFVLPLGLLLLEKISSKLRIIIIYFLFTSQIFYICANAFHKNGILRYYYSIKNTINEQHESLEMKQLLDDTFRNKEYVIQFDGSTPHFINESKREHKNVSIKTAWHDFKISIKNNNPKAIVMYKKWLNQYNMYKKYHEDWKDRMNFVDHPVLDAYEYECIYEGKFYLLFIKK